MEKKEGKVIKILMENGMIFLEKYENKTNMGDLNMSLVANIKALECNLYVPD